jgi:hypothetical protein
VLDCIGSLEGSLKPIAKLVKRGAKVAIMLPVIVKDSTEDTDPIYTLDVTKGVAWAEGVDARGVSTHSHLKVFHH